MTPLILAAACAIVALFLFVLTVIVFRRAVQARNRLIETIVDIGLRPRCPAEPLPGVPCGRPRGHIGRHYVYAGDVVDAGYAPTPF